MKQLTKEQYFEAEELIIQAENILRYTEMDSESQLLNRIWSYLRFRADTLKAEGKLK